MRTFRFIAIGFFITAFSAMAVFAQTAQTTGVALVNTNAFYIEKTGINKIENAYKSLNAEFKTTFDDIKAGVTRLQALQKELQTLQQQASDPNNKVPINKDQVQSKVDEYEKLQVDLKRKQEDAKARYSKREAAVLGPIVQDVGKSLGEYAQKRGFSLVMDSSKLFEAGILLFSQDATDITKGFIDYYNSQPGGTAATRRP